MNVIKIDMKFENIKIAKGVHEIRIPKWGLADEKINAGTEINFNSCYTPNRIPEDVYEIITIDLNSKKQLIGIKPEELSLFESIANKRFEELKRKAELRYYKTLWRRIFNKF